MPVSATLTAAQPELEWNVAGTGDFNGDGRDDILWPRDDGLTYIWERNGSSIVHAAPTNLQRAMTVRSPASATTMATAKTTLSGATIHSAALSMSGS